MIPTNRPTGCPCGCGFRDPCVLSRPLRVVAVSPCTHACRSFGHDEIRYYSRTLGTCPCNLGETP